MKPFLYLSIWRGIGFLLFLVLGFSCQKENDMATPTAPKTLSPIKSEAGRLNLSQTGTSNSWYNANNNMYERWGTQYVAADENSYAYSKKVLKI